jgi:AcrR family transcriptional regulator
MVQQPNGSPQERVPLSRERVLRGAMAVADAAGVRALTIRSLAAELGVKPMSVYYYVANKSEILDGIDPRRPHQVDSNDGGGGVG